MKRLSILAILLWGLVAYPQSEAANWYFGYGAGVRFDQVTGAVSPLNDGRLSTNEGCASISDDTGQLLFYTDGQIVYNSQHNIMQNGSGLYGDNSSTQSAIIAPKPNDPNIYYVFTVDNSLDGRNDGLNYSIIDISANNGLGAVIQKNINLLPYCSEKITVVQKDCITGSLWLLTFSSESGLETSLDTYYAFEISDEGISNSPVKSTFEFDNFSGQGVTDIRGYLVLSPDGTSLASANMRSGLYIYDFDDETGVVSSQKRLTVDNRAYFPYGVAYSPNSELLYVHSSNDFFSQNNQENNDPSNHFSVLTQFQVNSMDVQSTAIVLDARNLYRGGLQLGPNGRIYRALSINYTTGYSYLGAINSPNQIGEESNYRHNAVGLGENTSSQGLPPFIQSFFNTELDIIQNGTESSSLSLCEGEEYTLQGEVIPGATYVWKKNDQLIQNNSPSLVVSTEGYYEVYIDPNNGECPLEGEAYVQVNELPEASDGYMLQCDADGTDDGSSLFNLSEAKEQIVQENAQYVVSFYSSLSEAERRNGTKLDENEYRNTQNPQRIIVKVVDPETRCYSIAELMLEVSYQETQTIDLRVCDDDGQDDGFYEFDLSEAEYFADNADQEIEISYYQNVEDALLKRNQLPLSYTNETEREEIIYGRAENEDSCYGISQIRLVVNSLPQIELEAETIYCLNYSPDPVTLDAGLGGKSENLFTYLWSTGETSAEIEINTPGNYSVSVTNQNDCSVERNILVNASNTAEIVSVEVDDASTNNSVRIITSGEGEYEYSLDDPNGVYQDENTFTGVAPGLYTVYIRDKNGCGIISDEISVIGFPKFFTPNGDGINDRWQVKGISERFQPRTTIFIFDRFGNLVKKLNPLSAGWDGKIQGKPLNSTDYWFRVLLEDGREFEAHFSLRR